MSVSTHVLNAAEGIPAAGMKIELLKIGKSGQRKLIAETVTNDDGRTHSPILEKEDMEAGVYEMIFHAGKYFQSRDPKQKQPAFLDIIPIRFGIANISEHYHVPLIATPWSYSTLRGS